jgi:hypothetical protein
MGSTENLTDKYRSLLPLPSEVISDDLHFPFYDGIDPETGRPWFGQITFTKEVHDGIVIGWNLKE